MDLFAISWSIQAEFLAFLNLACTLSSFPYSSALVLCFPQIFTSNKLPVCSSSPLAHLAGQVSQLSPLQVLNHPDLLIVKDQDECKDVDEEIKQEKTGVDILDWSQFLPEGYIEGDINQSGKLTVLFQLLSEVKSSQDRIVIVSNYTTTLRLLEIFCLAKGFPTVRSEAFPLT